MKKFWKITRTTLLVLIALILFLWLALQTSLVQNWLVGQVTGKLSRDLHTTVEIKHVDFSFFDKMNLEGTLIKDLNKDTLLYAGVLTVSVNDWFFFKDNIELKYIGLKDSYIHLKRSDSTWNTKFLADYFGGGSKKDSSKPIQLDLKMIDLDNIHFLQEDGWRGEDMEMKLGKLTVDADKVDLASKTIHIRSLLLAKPIYAITEYEGNRPDSLIPKDDFHKIKNDTAHLRWNPEHWSIKIDDLSLTDGEFRTIKKGDPPTDAYFDGSNIRFFNIQGKFKDVRLVNDSILASVNITAKERSGLEVTQLNAAVRFHPEAMEFDKLDLRTPKSRLHNYFAMRYDSFDELSSFISKVKLEGNFDNAELNSDDIAYFAPPLQKWKKKIRVQGRITGTVEDLQAKNLIVEAGNNTYLNGNIHMTGLPEIEKTYIDFDANSFRTTYIDAVALIPQLKEITQPRLDLMEFLRFKGNFTGFINDFVTYGTLETKLGTIVSDLNMKLPEKGNTRYSGNLQTNGFDIGRFFGMDEVGKISFKGKVDGNGVKMNNLTAKLDGTVAELDINGYTYRNLSLRGTIAKKLFNGNFASNDPNFDAVLEGLIDFSKEVPKFDFVASIQKADLQKIKITKDPIEFSGKFRFDFSGNSIDNFLGDAHIYDANLIHKGTRLPFDSLTVESKVLDNNKVITVLSNEFDAALVGEFTINELPSAFQTFLNKYYPSYIKPSKKATKNENFSFVITTKNVQDYLDLFVSDLKGFNYSTITGRINNRENLLDINAEIPQFSYKTTSFYNLALKGSGTMNNLSLETNIADVYINDSLHFPGTTININSANDTSDVKIVTSASQTLNAANLSAKVNTRANGISILFNESTFDINGKSWTINKNGELVLSRDLVSAEGVRIYNGQQEILITTVPSDIGNTNDIKINLQKINIGDFTPYFVRSNRLEGLLTATVDIIDPFGKLQIDVSGDAEQFRLDDDSVGRLALNANYNQKTGKVNFNGVSDNQDYKFDLKGVFNTLDSTNEKQLDIVTNLNNTKIDLLERYLSSIFTSVTGFATGQLRIVGPLNNLKYLGDVGLKEGKLHVGFTNVTYLVPEAKFQFKDDRIDFGTFFIRDTLGNVGTVSKGILRHEGFDNMDFDFGLSTNKLLVLNTNNLTTDPFYGKVIAKASLSLTGPLEDMVMNIKGQPADSSSFFIRAGDSRESGQADFIVWKTYGKEMIAQNTSKGSKLTMLMDITANNLIATNVIIDELTNDVMSAIGHGNLKLRATTNGELDITGQYDIDKGNYNFNFQSLIRKPFVLKGGVGSYIRWSGNPYDAELKVTAEYEADNVKFSDLGDRLAQQAGGDIEYIKKYRGKVRVVAHLSDNLMKPDIKFNLEMPESSPLKSDPLVANLLRQIENDPNELNKQVAFLIIFNSFGPMSTSSQAGLGGIAVEGIVTNSISGFISSALNKQFSNIVQKLFNDESIKVNFNAQLYNGSYLLDNGATASNSFNIDRTSLNFSMAKSLFNERLTFTFGSAFDFGLTAAQAKATQNLQFLPDITAEWKLRPDGKLLLTFFYRDSYNYQSASGKQNRSGAGISYRRDFEHLSDLWRSDRKKKKVKPLVPEVTADSTSTGSNF